jgi:dTDP-D-glucose 4,6-dehydratase
MPRFGEGEIYRIALDTTKTRMELGWEANLPFKEGIPSTLKYYKARSGFRN